ncbi:MAG TPA: hypothetical protein EYO27_02220 [Candidatus Marinimicrobia bacterium]|jgi:hypothetical protein|nr:hypothetical protein [Candidatus Neomarinimicrobiota bacterium]HIB33816.1 hypothetical protein [Candidatus Neomarinimicrobiota bacterium]HIB80323.1 hypothetical protein [Candidatus Neomarinimicrobiota bacterium]
MKKWLLVVVIWNLSACVGPPGPDQGLVENLPVIINTNSAFSFLVRGDNYTFEENIDLSLNLPDGKTVASTLIVTEFKSTDTTFIQLVDVDGLKIYDYMVNANMTRVDQTASLKPKKAILQGNKFSGILEWVVTAN